MGFVSGVGYWYLIECVVIVVLKFFDYVIEGVFKLFEIYFEYVVGYNLVEYEWVFICLVKF